MISECLDSKEVRTKLTRLKETIITEQNYKLLTKTLDAIDDDIYDALIKGAKLAQRYRPTWWSSMLKFAALEVKYWRIRRSQVATKVSMK